MSKASQIKVRGARMHNLKNIDIDIPRDKIIVITGLSGSGKSSLAFDTIYAEGQRRYVESLSPYARQFLGQMDKPSVDSIDGLSPAISIDQKTTSKNPRSTVATVTEIHDYLRLLWARAGCAHCPVCDRVIAAQSTEQIVEQIMDLSLDKFMIAAPLVKDRKGDGKTLFKRLIEEGFVRVLVDGQIYSLDEEINLDKQKRHSISVIVDRLSARAGVRRRLEDACASAVLIGEGLVSLIVENEEEIIFSEAFACPVHGNVLSELEPRVFSFNSPHGACPSCSGLGALPMVDPELIILPSRSINEGALLPWSISDADFWRQLEKALAEHLGISLDTPFKDLPKKAQQGLLFGINDPVEISYERRRGPTRTQTIEFTGLVNDTNRRYQNGSEWTKSRLEQFISPLVCADCKGQRLRPESRAVLVDNLSLPDLAEMSIDDAFEWINNINLEASQQKFAAPIIKEIKDRLAFLIDVGVGYLTLARGSRTLSGGESQRLRLATQIGSALTGVLYVLDEPSIGLHQSDNDRLLSTLISLKNLGNTVLIVEHDEQTMLASDQIIDLGPGAGESGGYLVAQGTAKQIMRNKNSVTGRYLSGKDKLTAPLSRRTGTDWLSLSGAGGHNLKNIDVRFPLNAITTVSGVSGSGKSTLVGETLLPAMERQIMGRATHPLAYKKITGEDKVDKVISVNQSPIGRTPRSNAATYIGLFDIIRDLFSKTKEARARGYKPGRFSFNVKGGRCENCSGGGSLTIQMHFLPDVEVTCPHCEGKRYNKETLEIRWASKTIADILDMPVEEAVVFFDKIPPAKRRLKALSDVGLDYLRLGQSATTLSGGEAQRIKLAAELSKVSTGKTLYILDEPTTGLHFFDVYKLLTALARLCDSGNTIIIIEHNLDVLAFSDWIIDLGPGGGDKGGEIIDQGTPEEIAAGVTATGKHLKQTLSAKI